MGKEDSQELNFITAPLKSGFVGQREYFQRKNAGPIMISSSEKTSQKVTDSNPAADSLRIKSSINYLASLYASLEA